MSSSSYVLTLDSLLFFLRTFAKCLDYILTFASGFFARCFLSAVQFSRYFKDLSILENDTVKEELQSFGLLLQKDFFP